MRKQYRKQIYSYSLSRSDESHFRTDARLCAQKKQACGTCLYSYTYCCLMLLCASLCGASFRPEFLCCGIKCNFTLSIPYFNCYVNVFSHLFYIFCLGESPELFMRQSPNQLSELSAKYPSAIMRSDSSRSSANISR